MKQRILQYNNASDVLNFVEKNPLLSSKDLTLLTSYSYSISKKSGIFFQYWNIIWSAFSLFVFI